MGRGNRNKRNRNSVGWIHTHTETRAIQRSDDHDDITKNNKNKKKIPQQERSQLLSHGTREHLESKKIQLHITKQKRDIRELRERLESWDDVEEEERHKKLVEKQRLEEEGEPKKKRRRLGPETWKLRGAARPAWEVYDFDTRYVCPHQKAHEEAKNKAKRIRNIFALYRGKFGNLLKEPGVLQPVVRQFLSQLVQLGHLNVEAQRYKQAREVFLECIELEGEDDITYARGSLMRMYMELKRFDSAKRLYESLGSNESVWIRYSTVLVEYIHWKRDSDASDEKAKEMLVKAIQSNPYCAYYIAFYDTFEKVMEYVDDIEDAESGTLLEAIEYCSSEQMEFWMDADGAVVWVKHCIQGVLRGDDDIKLLNKDDLEWSDRLVRDEKSVLASYYDSKRMDDKEEKSNDEKEEEAGEEQIDFSMYAGMFRTAMEMIEDAQEL